jgi:hypothetical protein
MHLNQMFPSPFLQASDFSKGERTLYIAEFEQKEIGGQCKNVLRFRGANKMLILNKTNARTIARAYGPDSRSWIGKPVTLFEAQVDFRGDLVPAIRVKIPASPQQAQDQHEPPFDDDVPEL